MLPDSALGPITSAGNYVYASTNYWGIEQFNKLNGAIKIIAGEYNPANPGGDCPGLSTGVYNAASLCSGETFPSGVTSDGHNLWIIGFSGSYDVSPIFELNQATPQELGTAPDGNDCSNAALLQPNAGDPVNTATGQQTETFTDLSAGGPGIPLTFARTYDSLLAQNQATSSSPADLAHRRLPSHITPTCRGIVSGDRELSSLRA